MDDCTLAIQEYQMRIVAGLDEDGEQCISTMFVKADTDELIPYFEGLGMLEAAKQDFIERWRADD